MPLILRITRGPDVGRQCSLASRTPIARLGTGDLPISDPQVSRVHATVISDSAGVRVADAGSSTGTYLNGRRVEGFTQWISGGTLRVGETQIRLLSPRRTIASSVYLVARDPSGAAHPITGSADFLIGRDAASGFQIDDPRVSRRHLRVRRTRSSIYITDLSSNGAAVNGQRLTHEREIFPGDQIELLSTGWRIEVAGGATRIPPDLLNVRAEDQETGLPAHVSAGPGATIGDVATAVAMRLGNDDGAWTFYSDLTGALHHPDDPWTDAQIDRAEPMVVTTAPVPDDSPRIPDRAPSPIFGGTQVIVPAIAAEPLSIPRAPATSDTRGRGMFWQVGGGLLAVFGAMALGIAQQNWGLMIVGALVGLGGVAFGLLGEQSRRRHALNRYRERLAEVHARRDQQGSSRAIAARALSTPLSQWPEVVAQRRPPLWSRTRSSLHALHLTIGAGTRLSGIIVEIPDEEPDAPLSAERNALSTPSTLSNVPLTLPAGRVVGIVGPRTHTARATDHILLEAAILHPPSELHINCMDDTWEWAQWLPHHGTNSDAPLRLTVTTESSPGASSLTATERSSVFIVAEHEWQLPPNVTDRIVLNGDTATYQGDAEFAPVGSFTYAQVNREDAQRLGRWIGALRDPRLASHSAVAPMSLLEQSGARHGGVLDVRANWQSPLRLAAVVGSDENGTIVELDLRADGPHAFLAGTTGSGKSETLAAILASLISRYRPEDLNLFLIDYKGGATFDRFARAPHVVGVVTDLEGDSGLTQRAFATLDAEIARRKRVLRAAGVGDTASLRLAPGTSTLPSLVVVIDEFALLANSYPDAKHRLDLVAAQGRSLGIHLLLSTQNPSGVVTPAIRANTNVWVSLRVVSAADSREILGSDAASLLPIDEPGRGLFRRGAEDRLTAFHTARVTIPWEPGGASTVRVEIEGAAPSNSASRSSSSFPDDLDLLVNSLRDLADRHEITAAPSLWAPPLPTELHAVDLPNVRTSGDLPVLLGLADVVTEQRQDVLSVDLSAAGLLVTGASRTGKTAALRQVAASIASTNSPDRVHIFALDPSGSLNELNGFPHTAGVVDPLDSELLGRLILRLTEHTQLRRRDPSVPRAVLLIDDYITVKSAIEQMSDPLMMDRLLALFTAGRGGGVHVAIATSQPADLRINVASAFEHRVMLRPVERTDYQAIDWRPDRDAPIAGIPGRAMIAGPVEVQLALPGPQSFPHAAGGPAPLRVMPDAVTLEALPRSAHGDVIGVGGVNLDPVAIDASPGDHLAVLGERGSGRSTALLTIAQAHLAARGGRLLVFALNSGPLEILADHPNTALFVRDPESLGALIDLAREPGGPTLLLFDDASAFPASHGDRLDSLLREAPRLNLRFATAARPADWTRSFDSWVRFVSSLRSALVFGPMRDLTAHLDVRVPPPLAPDRPGRGHLVQRGQAVHLQVAITAEAQSPQS